MLFILANFHHPDDDDDPPATKITADGVVWHRAPGENPEAFRNPIEAEAKPSGPRFGIVGFLE